MARPGRGLFAVIAEGILLHHARERPALSRQPQRVAVHARQARGERREERKQQRREHARAQVRALPAAGPHGAAVEGGGEHARDWHQEKRGAQPADRPRRARQHRVQLPHVQLARRQLESTKW